MRKTWTIFNSQTGQIVSRFTGTDRRLASNIPNGCEAIEGAFDHEAQRVDVSSRRVLDDHELARVSSDRRNKDARLRAARSRIALLTRKQERAVREHLLGIVPSAADRAAGAMTLTEIEEEISTQRATIRAIEAESQSR